MFSIAQTADLLEFLSHDVKLTMSIAVGILRVTCYEPGLHANAAAALNGLTLPQTYVSTEGSEEHSLTEFRYSLARLWSDHQGRCW